MALPTNSEGELPPWDIGWLIWILLAIGGLAVTVMGWFTKKYIVKKIDDHDTQLGAIPATYATIIMVKEMEDKIPDLVTRKELVSYMQQMKDDSDKRHGAHLEAQLRMHAE